MAAWAGALPSLCPDPDRCDRGDSRHRARWAGLVVLASRRARHDAPRRRTQPRRGKLVGGRHRRGYPGRDPAARRRAAGDGRGSGERRRHAGPLYTTGVIESISSWTAVATSLPGSAVAAILDRPPTALPDHGAVRWCLRYGFCRLSFRLLRVPVVDDRGDVGISVCQV
jgi:hypothetical protein